MKLEKITKQSDASRRRYEDACGTAHALDLIGERWALLIVRELMFGPKRFSDLRTDLPGISANVLTQRLEGLEEFGIIQRRKLPPPASVQVYELTPWGLEARPIVESMGRWAIRSPHHDPTMPISVVGLMSSFRTMFSSERAGDMDACIAVRFGPESFLVRIGRGKIDVARTEFGTADVIFEGTPAGLGGAVYGGQTFDALAAKRALSVTGNRALADRFLTLFPLPPKA
jgi:DNA-binding HxlR family transcriptional regulator